MINNLLISVAKGELPADLILANARVVNVFTGEIEPGNVAICGDRIAGVGDYHQAKQGLRVPERLLISPLFIYHTCRIPLILSPFSKRLG